MLHALTHPDLFSLTGPDGQVFRGGDQDWYPDAWQRRSGCGPTAAAAVLSYLSRVHPALTPLAPRGGNRIQDFLAYMEAIWPYVTPGPRGLDKPESFTVGCRSFALSRGCVLTGRTLDIPAKTQGGRPSPADCRDFIAAALDADCPVAFLNFSNGDLNNLDSWHWVPLIAMTEGEDVLLCSVLDSGEEKVLDFARWLETSQLGGALAAVFPDHTTHTPSEVPMIQLAQPRDLDGVDATYTELLLHEQETGVSTTNWALNVYPTRSFAQAAQEAGTLYVLRDGDQIAASMILNHEQAEDYQKIPWLYPAEPEEVLVIHTLCIPPSQARKGIGRRMVQFALEKAKEMGCRVIRLDTWNGNQPAAKLYGEAFGFRFAGRAQVLHQGLIPEELIFFEKEL